MTYFVRVNFKAIGAPDPEPLPCAKARELYARCNARSIDTCELFQNIVGMVPKNRKAALAGLYKLIQVAASGEPITNFYDKKQCHDCHTFRYMGKDRTIWRIWKGDIRIAFYYGEGQTILLTNAFAKYEDKLTLAQKTMLENEVITYIDAEHSKSVHFFEIK